MGLADPRPPIKAQLQQLQRVIDDPDRATFGVDAPTGLAGRATRARKTTVAKVLAAQAKASFYPISGADVISNWLGDRRNIRQLFEHARNRPSIVFIDEIDAIAARRGRDPGTRQSRQPATLEIDGISGQRGVFVIGATNRPDQLDSALLAAEALADDHARACRTRRPDSRSCAFTAGCRTVGVSLEEARPRTEGMSPADLRALTQEAALAAMTRAAKTTRPLRSPMTTSSRHWSGTEQEQPRTTGDAGTSR